MAVLAALDTDPEQGLSDAEAARRSRRFGPNLLRHRRPAGPWRILLNQFESLVVWLLAAAAALSLLLGDIAEGFAILIVLALNSAIGFVTEWKAVRSVEALRQVARVATRVRRDGAVRAVPAESLVPGDIVLVEGGDIVTADLRLIEASRMQADESLLTGESTPVSKGTAPVPEDAPLAERTSMLFKGTVVTRGNGAAVVLATGMATELGHIADLAAAAEPEQSPLEKRLARLGGQLIWLTLAVVTVIGGVGFASGAPPLLMLEAGVALAVAAIPEGLPIVATLALARGMWRMARKNALVERLGAVETLGATTVIVADKTGTLTENRMAVSRLALPSGGWEATADAAPASEVREALTVAVLCNDATLASAGGAADAATGDPTEIALLRAGAAAGLHRATLLADLPELREEAFDPDTKMMATVHRAADGFLYAVKGAPEAVLPRATRIRTGDGGDAPLARDGRQRWLAEAARLAADGQRVLALALKRAAGATDDPYAELIFLGLVGLLDPPREDVPQAISDCIAAGIRVVMLTGDHAATARAIGRRVGLPEGEVIEGGALPPLPELDDAARARLAAVPVLARMSPAQKLDLVALYQRSGEIVAMTGDGVNDAPSLKKADIGVAMGLRGTQVAREAADMVLADDAFPTIVAAVREGRVIFDNIRKFVVYLLSCNLSEILVVGIAVLAGLPLPILPLQILFLNLVTDVFPAFSLAAGEGEAGVMARPPRDPAEPILTRRHWLSIAGYGMLITAATLTALAIARWVLMLPQREAVTISFLTLAFAQLWHVFNMRGRSARLIVNEVTANPVVWGALALCVLLLLGAVHIPLIADVLKLVPPDRDGWTVVLGASLAPLLLAQLGDALRKGVRR
ncbi:MAG: cation-transporting P-type ATPase [Rhodospirillales bacterium]|nr:MAG: cation-transporting P-type ATPase [Rhodospirillales bacterium]